MTLIELNIGSIEFYQMYKSGYFDFTINLNKFAGFSAFQTHIFATRQHFGSQSKVFCLQSGSATNPLSGMFANFSPKLKFFLHLFAFLYFSMQIYYQQSSL